MKNDSKYITKNNPHGCVSKCGDQTFHRPHQYLAGWGNYTTDYCPGRAAGKKTRKAAELLVEQSMNWALETGDEDFIDEIESASKRVLKALGIV